MSRYDYNKRSMSNEREIIEETDKMITYRPNKNDYMNKEIMKQESCSLNGRDILSKNRNYIYHKIINRTKEIYGKDCSYFIDTYFKKFVINDIKTMILSSSLPRRILKDKGFETLFNIRNLNMRLIETLNKENIISEFINGDIFKKDKDEQVIIYSNKLDLYLSSLKDIQIGGI